MRALFGEKCFHVLVKPAWKNNTGNQSNMFQNTDGAYIPVSLTLDASGCISQEDLVKAAQNWNVQKEAIETQIGAIETWNTSKVTNMNNLFSNRGSFNEDIGFQAFSSWSSTSNSHISEVNSLAITTDGEMFALLKENDNDVRFYKLNFHHYSLLNF